MSRYSSVSGVGTTAPTTIADSPRYGYAPAREPHNVVAELVEYVVVAATCMGYVVAPVMVYQAFSEWATLTHWHVLIYGSVIVFCVALPTWAIYSVSVDKWQKTHDRAQWEVMEARLANVDKHLQKALEDNDKLRVQLRTYETPLQINGRQSAVGVQLEQDEPSVQKGPKATTRVEPVAPIEEAAAEYRKQREAAIREMARRFALGFAYDRDTCVREGVMTAGMWRTIMQEAVRKGVAKASGRGGRLVFTVFRSEDILRALLSTWT